MKLFAFHKTYEMHALLFLLPYPQNPADSEDREATAIFGNC
jgi:hypothetical protein